MGGWLFSSFFGKLLGLFPFLFRLVGGLIAARVLAMTVADILAVLNALSALVPAGVVKSEDDGPRAASSAPRYLVQSADGLNVVTRDGGRWAAFAELDAAEDYAAIMNLRRDR